MGGLSGIQMTFKHQTICHPTSFGPFKYPTSPVFRSPRSFKILFFFFSDISSRRSSGCSLRSSSSSCEVTHSSPPTIMEGPIMLSHHHVRADSTDSYTSPPTFSRLPPDGHEFPPDYREPANSAASSYHQVC